MIIVSAIRISPSLSFRAVVLNCFEFSLDRRLCGVSKNDNGYFMDPKRGVKVSSFGG